jgi:hypothetical protein
VFICFGKMGKLKGHSRVYVGLMISCYKIVRDFWKRSAGEIRKCGKLKEMKGQCIEYLGLSSL